jgi:hypothetical protein
MGLVELGRYPSSATAHIVRGRLEADGIQAFCFDTGMNFAEGAQLLFPVRVMVLDEDLAEARKLVGQAAVEDGPPDRHPSAGWLKRRRRAYALIGVILASWLVWCLLVFAD